MFNEDVIKVELIRKSLTKTLVVQHLRDGHIVKKIVQYPKNVDVYVYLTDSPLWMGEISILCWTFTRIDKLED